MFPRQSPVGETGGPFLSSTRSCRMGLPASPAYSNCRSEGAWALSTPGPMSGAPYTSLLPCNAPACLDSPVPLEHCSNMRKRCSGPLFLSAGPSVPVAPVGATSLSHSRTTRGPCPDGVNNLTAFLYSSSSSSCVFSCVPLSFLSSLHENFYLPTNDATRVSPRLTFTSSASVLLHA